jgi:hypothetical protein
VLVLKGQDIVVLLALASGPPPASERRLAAELGYNQAEVHRARARLTQAGLYDKERERVLGSQAEEFLVHGLKYLAPPQWGGETRGVPTAWAAEPLRGQLAPASELPPVWPDPEGRTRGLALQPLHPIVPSLAVRKPELGELLALVDAIRAGDARTRGLAESLLRDRLRATARP